MKILFIKYLQSIYYMLTLFWVLGFRGEKDRHGSYFSTTMKLMSYLESFTLKIHKPAIKCYKVTDIIELRLKRRWEITYYLTSVPTCTLFCILTPEISRISQCGQTKQQQIWSCHGLHMCIKTYMEWVSRAWKKGRQWWRHPFKDSWWFKNQ